MLADVATTLHDLAWLFVALLAVGAGKDFGRAYLNLMHQRLNLDEAIIAEAEGDGLVPCDICHGKGEAAGGVCAKCGGSGRILPEEWKGG